MQNLSHRVSFTSSHERGRYNGLDLYYEWEPKPWDEIYRAPDLYAVVLLCSRGVLRARIIPQEQHDPRTALVRAPFLPIGAAVELLAALRPLLLTSPPKEVTRVLIQVVGGCSEKNIKKTIETLSWIVKNCKN